MDILSLSKTLLTCSLPFLFLFLTLFFLFLFFYSLNWCFWNCGPKLHVSESARSLWKMCSPWPHCRPTEWESLGVLNKLGDSKQIKDWGPLLKSTGYMRFSCQPLSSLPWQTRSFFQVCHFWVEDSKLLLCSDFSHTLLPQVQLFSSVCPSGTLKGLT